MSRLFTPHRLQPHNIIGEDTGLLGGEVERIGKQELPRLFAATGGNWETWDNFIATPCLVQYMG